MLLNSFQNSLRVDKVFGHYLPKWSRSGRYDESNLDRFGHVTHDLTLVRESGKLTAAVCFHNGCRSKTEIGVETTSV